MPTITCVSRGLGMRPIIGPQLGSSSGISTLLIICGRHDESAGYRDSLRLLELYPQSTYIVLDRGTHGLPVGETGFF